MSEFLVGLAFVAIVVMIVSTVWAITFWIKTPESDIPNNSSERYFARLLTGTISACILALIGAVFIIWGIGYVIIRLVYGW